MSNTTNEKWSSNLGFILASCGSAIGLSNIWKFPYTMGQSGGGLFLLFYILATLLIAIPGLIIDTMLGREGRGLSPIESTKNILQKSGKPLGIWKIYGIIGAVGGVILLSYYSIIGGWSLGYIFKSLDGSITKIKTGDESFSIFLTMISDPKKLFINVLIVLIPTIFVVGLGIEKGIEKFTTIFVGFMLGFSLLLLIIAFNSPGFMRAIEFMFKPDFTKLTPKVLIEATGQALFSVSVGFCGVSVYGSMLDKKENIVKNSMIVALINTLFSIIIGISIFSLVFSKGLDPSAGVSLVFGVFPLILNELPFHQIMLGLFFFMIYFAALTSTFNMLEIPVQSLMGLGIKRFASSIICGITCILLSIIPILGFNVWENVRLLPFGIWKDMQILDVIDFFIANFFFPLNGIILFIIMGWIVSKDIKKSQLNVNQNNINLFNIHEILIKYIAPMILVMIIFLTMIGFIKF